MQGLAGFRFVLVTFLSTSTCGSAIVFKQVQAASTLDGYLPNSGFLFEFKTANIDHCAARCIPISPCRSFFYDSYDWTCQLHAFVYASSTVLVNSSTSATSRYFKFDSSEEWIVYEKSRYLFGEPILSYMDAREFCVNRSSHLVQVDSISEFDFLRNKMRTLPHTADFWNDLFEVTVNGQERWRTSNDPINPAVPIWTPNNPDDYLGCKESCSYFQARFDYKISDVSCDNDVRPDGHVYPRFDNRPVCEAEF